MPYSGAEKRAHSKGYYAGKKAGIVALSTLQKQIDRLQVHVVASDQRILRLEADKVLTDIQLARLTAIARQAEEWSS